MAINAYIGIPGSGKTYEVVHSVILPAFLAGRRVVTNIEGINESNFLIYVEKLNSKRKEDNRIELDKLGKIINVSDDDVLKENFFPYKGSTDDLTIAQKGDLICIDEVWRIFDEAKKIKDEHRSFLAEHRHFVNENGNTCDLVVISQSVSNIPRFIKDRIENTFKMTKLKSLGLNSRYRIDVYLGSKTFKVNLLHSIQSKYDPDIFKLYKSYDADNAQEQSIDKRTNIFTNRLFIFKFIFSLMFFIAGSIYLYIYFNSASVEQSPANEVEHTQVTLSQPTHKSQNKGSTKSYREQYQEKRLEIERKPLSKNWRIVGYLERKGKKLVVLSDGNYLRYEPSSNFTHSGNMLVGVIDDEKVTIYSGNKRKDVFVGVGFKNEK